VVLGGPSSWRGFRQERYTSKLENERRVVPASCHYQYTAGQGTCGKAPLMPHDRRSKPEKPMKIREARNACVVVNIFVARELLTDGEIRGSTGDTRRGG